MKGRGGDRQWRGGNPRAEERALMAKKKGGGVARRARGRLGVRAASIAREEARERRGGTARWIRRGRASWTRVARRVGATSPKWERMVPPKRRRRKRTEGGRQRPVARGGLGTHRPCRRWGPYPCRAYDEAGTCAAATPWSSAAARCGRSPGGSSSPQAVYAPRVRSLTAQTMRPFARRSSIADCAREAEAGVSARSARDVGARPDLGPLAARARRRRRRRGAYLPVAETRS